MSDPRIRRGLGRQLDDRRRAIQAGRRPIGWKAGFGAPAGLERFRLDGPLVGFLTDASLLDDGATVDIGGWSRPVAEPEIAVWIGQDIPRDGGEHEVRRAIRALAPAIELADVDPPPEEVEEILAGNIFHRGVILGPPDEAWAGGHIDGVTARITLGGEPVEAPDDLESLTGRVADVVGHLSRLIADAGEQVREGDVIITGSLTPPLPLTPATTVTYELSGFPTLTVTTAE